MNTFCPDCGWLMRSEPEKAFFRCPNCNLVRSQLEVYRAWDPVVRHGTRCEACDGTGTVEHEFTEWHPYGDTVAPEHLVEELDCDECLGKGYFLDERGKACVICGRDIPNGTGVLVEGWRLHEDPECYTDDPPKLEGFDA